MKVFPLLSINNSNEYEVLFHIGTWSGLRLKDAVLMKWEDVDFQTNNIYLTPAKTKKYNTKVKIPIHPLLYQKFNKASSWRMDDYVLPNLAEQYKHNDKSIGKIITKILAKNGFKNEIPENSTRKIAPCLYGFHSLRYTFVAACAKAGIPLALVQEIVGHSNPAMTKHYTRYDDKYRQNAINSITYSTDETSNIRAEVLRKLILADEDKLNLILKILDS